MCRGQVQYHKTWHQTLGNEIFVLIFCVISQSNVGEKIFTRNDYIVTLKLIYNIAYLYVSFSSYLPLNTTRQVTLFQYEYRQTFWTVNLTVKLLNLEWRNQSQVLRTSLIIIAPADRSVSIYSIVFTRLYCKRAATVFECKTRILGKIVWLFLIFILYR